MTETRKGRALPVTDLSLVVLVGASGSGKSTFARRHFKPTEVISSDFCRGLVCDDENDQGATRDAFDVLHYIAGKRLAAGRRTVVDATSVQQDSRRQLIELAKKYDVLPIAIVLDVPEEVCAERNAARTDRADMPRRVIQRHIRELRRSLRHWSARASARCMCCAGPRRPRAPPSSPRSGSTTSPTSPAPSTSSATSTAAPPNWSRCSASWAMSTASTPRAVRPSSSATWSTAARTPRACCAG